MNRLYGLLPERYPAVVESYDPTRRTCRVAIPGITDGGDVLPEAEIEYPIGDKSASGTTTEIEILPGDTVWIAFIGGDPRYPLITGYRNPQSGNDTDWRRWHHANIEVIAEAVLRLLVDTTQLEMTPGNASLSADENIALNVGGAKIDITDGSITINGSGSTKGVVQGDCICAFTGRPHGHISSTVAASQ